MSGKIDSKDVLQMSDIKKLKRCPICGCTEHTIVGCATHWRTHMKIEGGNCEVRKDNSN